MDAKRAEMNTNDLMDMGEPVDIKLDELDGDDVNGFFESGTGGGEPGDSTGVLMGQTQSGRRRDGARGRGRHSRQRKPTCTEFFAWICWIGGHSCHGCSQRWGCTVTSILLGLRCASLMCIERTADRQAASQRVLQHYISCAAKIVAVNDIVLLPFFSFAFLRRCHSFVPSAAFLRRRRSPFTIARQAAAGIRQHTSQNLDATYGKDTWLCISFCVLKELDS